MCSRSFTARRSFLTTTWGSYNTWEWDVRGTCVRPFLGICITLHMTARKTEQKKGHNLKQKWVPKMSIFCHNHLQLRKMRIYSSLLPPLQMIVKVASKSNSFVFIDKNSMWVQFEARMVFNSNCTFSFILPSAFHKRLFFFSSRSSRICQWKSTKQKICDKIIVPNAENVWGAHLLAIFYCVRFSPCLF